MRAQCEDFAAGTVLFKGRTGQRPLPIRQQVPIAHRKIAESRQDDITYKATDDVLDSWGTSLPHPRVRFISSNWSLVISPAAYRRLRTSRALS